MPLIRCPVCRRVTYAYVREDPQEENAEMTFAEAVDKGYLVVELREMDDGDSLFVTVHPDDVEKTSTPAKQLHIVCGER